MDRTAEATSVAQRSFRRYGQPADGRKPVPTEMARVVAAAINSSERLVAERDRSRVMRPPPEYPRAAAYAPPAYASEGAYMRAYAGEAHSQGFYQRPRSAGEVTLARAQAGAPSVAPETEHALAWSEQAGPGETPMSIRMQNRKRFLAAAARRHALKAGTPPPASPPRSGPCGPSIGTPSGPIGWLEQLMNEHAPSDYTKGVDASPASVYATRAGSGVTVDADGTFRMVRHYGPGHIGHERSKRGIPAGYGGFIPEHIKHDCVGSGRDFKIGSTSSRLLAAAASANALHASAMMRGGKASTATPRGGGRQTRSTPRGGAAAGGRGTPRAPRKSAHQVRV